MPSLVYRIINCIRAAVFPDKCLCCRAFFNFDEDHLPPNAYKGAAGGDFSGGHPFARLMAPVLCPECRLAFSPVEPPFCTVCGMVFKSRAGENHTCGACLDAPWQFSAARAAGIYDQSLMTLVHCLKYRGKLQLVRPLSRLLLDAFCRYWQVAYFDLIIPVPLHKKKLRSRGFNQAHLLVNEWPAEISRRQGTNANIHIAPDALVRQKWTRPQTGLGRKGRISNIKNAFDLPDASVVSGKRILLVDDVFTTGSTVSECARVLMHGGAKCVNVLTLARAMAK
jgi:ComF family protein